MFQKLEDVEKRYDDLTLKISDPEVISNQSEWTKLMKEHAEIQEVVEKYKEYKKIQAQYEEAKAMLEDAELKELAQIEMEDGVIKGILPYGTKEVDEDYGEEKIIPGMIDIHCHGGLGFDTNDAHREGLVMWAKGLLEEGITGFCPTTVTQSVEVLTNAVKNVCIAREEILILFTNLPISIVIGAKAVIIPPPQIE